MFKRLTKLVRIMFLLLNLLFLFSCDNQTTPEDVMGVYTANHGKGLDILKINPDGTYEHIYVEKDKKYINKNRWSFEMADNRISGITLTDFRSFFRGRKTGGYWYKEIEYDIFGNTRFCIDPDLYYYYIKNTPVE